MSEVIEINIKSDNSDDIARQLFGQVKDPDIVCEIISSLSTMLSDDDKNWCMDRINRYISPEKKLTYNPEETK